MEECLTCDAASLLGLGLGTLGPEDTWSEVRYEQKSMTRD